MFWSCVSNCQFLRNWHNHPASRDRGSWFWNRALKGGWIFKFLIVIRSGMMRVGVWGRERLKVTFGLVSTISLVWWRAPWKEFSICSTEWMRWRRCKLFFGKVFTFLFRFNGCSEAFFKFSAKQLPIAITLQNLCLISNRLFCVWLLHNWLQYTQTTLIYCSKYSLRFSMVNFTLACLECKTFSNTTHRRDNGLITVRVFCWSFYKVLSKASSLVFCCSSIGSRKKKSSEAVSRMFVSTGFLFSMLSSKSFSGTDCGNFLLAYSAMSTCRFHDDTSSEAKASKRRRTCKVGLWLPP